MAMSTHGTVSTTDMTYIYMLSTSIVQVQFNFDIQIDIEHRKLYYFK